MRYKTLPNTELEVSEVGLGTWVFGGDCWQEADDAVSVSVVEEAIDKGMTFIDTAPIYGSGRSETVIGKALKGKRDQAVVATKCGIYAKGKGIAIDLSAGAIRQEIEDSLRRLGIETIDLYQCHWPDEKTPMEESFGELNKLVEEGKIRYIGISNFDKVQTEKALSLAPVVTNQVQYSLFDRTIEEGLLPICEENKVSIISYGSLGGGILSGKYKEPPMLQKGDVRSFFYRFYKEPFWSKGKELVSVLEDIAKKRNVRVSEVAINWVLSNEGVGVCLAGCRTPEQVDMNIRAGNWQLSSEELGLISKEYSRIFAN